MQERRKLSDNVLDLEKFKNLDSENLKTKEKFYNNLPINLQNIENETINAQKLLNIDFTLKSSNLKYAENLPLPLYVLFNSLSTLPKNEYYNFTLEIKSNLTDEALEQAIIAFYSKYPLEKFMFNESKENDNLNESEDTIENNNNTNNNANTHKNDYKEEGEHSDNEEGSLIFNSNSNNNKKKKKKVKNLHSLDKGNSYTDDKKFKENYKMFKEYKNNKLNLNTFELSKNKLQKFPQFLQFTVQSIKCNESNELVISQETNNTITIFFYFIPILNIVTIEINNEINTDDLLSNLFVHPFNLNFIERQRINDILRKII